LDANLGQRKAPQSVTFLLTLLRNKHRCLVKFLELSRAFLTEARIGDFSRLDTFERGREAILKTIALYDRKISLAITELGSMDRSPALMAEIEKLLRDKDELLKQIFDSDQLVIAEIIREQDRIQRELKSTERNQAMVKKFKSGWVGQSGDELDEKL